MKKMIAIFILLSVSAKGMAQQGFAYRSELDKVNETGPYKIMLRPEMLAKCKSDLSDLRILDSLGNFVPFALRMDTSPGRKYIGVPYPGIAQEDSSDKRSYIILQYRDRYRIDKIDLLLQGPQLFKRNARIYDPTNGNLRLIGETILSPGNLSVMIPGIRTDSLLLEIDNEDNKPLQVQAVQTAQLNQYLLTWLQAGSGYLLLAGKANAQAPEYDLKYFVDSLTKNPQEIPTGPVQPASPVIAAVAPPPHADHSGLLLWGILAIVLVLLASLSYKMMKAIPKESEHDRP